MTRRPLAELKREVESCEARITDCCAAVERAEQALQAAGQAKVDAEHALRIERGLRWLEKQPDGTADVVRGGMRSDWKRLRLGNVVRERWIGVLWEWNDIGRCVCEAVAALDAERAAGGGA